MGPTSFLQIVAISVGAIIGLGGLAATIWAIGKVRGVETSIELLNAANAGLREANADVRAELLRSERECAESIARLQGQNQALLDGLGDKLAEAIASRLERTLTAAAHRVIEDLARRSTDRQERYGTDADRRDGGRRSGDPDMGESTT